MSNTAKPPGGQPQRLCLVHIRANLQAELMSAFGTKQTFVRRRVMSAFGGKADTGRTPRNVRL